MDPWLRSNPEEEEEEEEVFQMASQNFDEGFQKDEDYFVFDDIDGAADIVDCCCFVGHDDYHVCTAGGNYFETIEHYYCIAS